MALKDLKRAIEEGAQLALPDLMLVRARRLLPADQAGQVELGALLAWIGRETDPRARGMGVLGRPLCSLSTTAALRSRWHSVRAGAGRVLARAGRSSDDVGDGAGAAAGPLSELLGGRETRQERLQRVRSAVLQAVETEAHESPIERALRRAQKRKVAAAVMNM